MDVDVAVPVFVEDDVSDRVLVLERVRDLLRDEVGVVDCDSDTEEERDADGDDDAEGEPDMELEGA